MWWWGGGAAESSPISKFVLFEMQTDANLQDRLAG